MIDKANTKKVVCMYLQNLQKI